MKCPHCNQEHPKGTLYCPMTGNKMPAEGMISCKNKDCPNYGKMNLPQNVRYCPVCGKSINISLYDEILSLNDGLARVRKDGKYGFIDKNGIEVIKCKYDFAEIFKEGLTNVHNYGEKHKFIDKNGNVVFLLDDSLDLYGDIVGFSEGLCRVGKKTDYNVNDEDSIVKYGFIDRTGKLVIDCKFDNASDFHNGRALVWDNEKDNFYESRDGNFRFIDINGCEVTGSFDCATEFRDGYAAVQIPTFPKRSEDFKIRIIDVNGKYVYKIERCYLRSRSSFYDNYGLHDKVFLYSNCKWIDLENGKKHSIDNDNLSINQDGFYDGLVAVKDSQGKWGLMNVEGEIIIECQFDDVYTSLFSDGLLPVKQNGLWGYIDRTGKVVIPHQYTKANCFSEGSAFVWKDNIFMVIDNSGNRIA